MKISNETYRIFQTSKYDSQTGQYIDVFLIVESDEIERVYSLNEFYQINPDYPEIDHQKYVMRDADHYTNECGHETYEPVDYQKEQEAIKNSDQDYFNDDSNFQQVDWDDYNPDFEIHEYWDGSNHKQKDLSHFDEITNEFDGAELKKNSSTKNGQGTGHDEYYELQHTDETIKLHRPVSYWQGDMNNVYVPVKS